MHLTPTSNAATAAPAAAAPAPAKTGRRWSLVVFSLPFIGVGVGTLAFLLVPTLVDAQRMQDWQRGEARLASAELVTSRQRFHHLPRAGELHLRAQRPYVSR